MFDISKFYKLASKEVQEIQFATKQEALKFRLRLYSERERKENAFLPAITILVRENMVIAGPKGFDLVVSFSPELKAKLEAMQKVEDDELSKMFAEVQTDRQTIAEGNAAGEMALKSLGFGGTKEEQEKAKQEIADAAYGKYAERTEEEKEKK